MFANDASSRAGRSAPRAGFAERSALVRSAYALAAAAHAGETQEADGTPYLDHVVAVARLVDGRGFDDEVSAAALLHDVVEHAGVDLERVRATFGPGVHELVDVMTDPRDGRPFAVRKASHRRRIAHAGERAAAIFVADNIAHVTTLRTAIARRGERAVAERLTHRLDDKVAHYRATLDMAVGLVDDGLTQLLARELDRLHECRAAVPPPAA